MSSDWELRFSVATLKMPKGGETVIEITLYEVMNAFYKLKSSNYCYYNMA